MFSSPEPTTGCWLWMGRREKKGYGSLHSNGTSYKAHRVSYELVKGPIPAGLEIDHLCRVRCCVNPDHLEAVTHRENIRRAVMPGKAPTTICPAGHAKEPRKICKECDRLAHRRPASRLRMAMWREAKKAVGICQRCWKNRCDAGKKHCACCLGLIKARRILAHELKREQEQQQQAHNVIQITVGRVKA